MRPLLFIALLVLLVMPLCLAQSPACCPACGCSQFQKSCRVVPDVKKETKTKWVVQCEDICLPGRTRSVDACVADPTSPTGQWVVTTRQPSCDRVITKKKLVKKTETIEKPGFKCIVETVCAQCGQCCP